jgi:putative polyketide hydroxylase
MADSQVPVLIVGGGVVGLSSALFLAQQGISTLLVEKHPGTSIHPRARGLNGRTMELMRGLGLEERIRTAGQAIASSMGVYSGATLRQVIEKRGDGGWVMRRMRARQKAAKGFTSKSPTTAARCTQDLLEPVLLAEARARGVNARFSTELVDVEQDAYGVRVTLLDRKSGSRSTVDARYLIAADGARSGIRTRLGVNQLGRGTLTHQLNIYFRSDLATLVKGRELSMCLVDNPQVRGLFASVNNTDLWVLHVAYRPDEGEKPEDFTMERVTGIVRAATGFPDLAVELKGVLPWQSAVRVAERFQHGRIFLAGDAAHIMPPWGGFGANTGIQDAHNLAWKVAAVLHGHAGEALLRSYDIERQPVALAVANIAGDMNDARGLMNATSTWRMLWKLRRAFPYFVVGYGYTSDAVATEDGPPPGPGTSDLKGRPGTRVPHIWLASNGRRLSSLDAVGTRLTLFARAEGQRWIAALHGAARQLQVPVDTVTIGHDVSDVDARFEKAFGVRRDGAALVRPDGMVAWRARRLEGDPDESMRRLLEKLLARAAGSEVPSLACDGVDRPTLSAASPQGMLGAWATA